MKPPKRITVRFAGDPMGAGFVEGVVLCFGGSRAWVHGHVYQLVPKRKRKAARK